MGPHPAVAQARLGVRRCLADLAPGDLVLAACSGGADSLALAAALAFEAPRLGLRAGGVTVDHGLQAGSAEQAGRVAALLRGSGSTRCTASVRCPPGRAAAAPRPPPGPPGTGRWSGRGAGRRGRRAARPHPGRPGRDRAARAGPGLGRPVAGRDARPGGPLPAPAARRAPGQLREACAAQGLEPWDDPHNTDPAYARVRVRHQAMPALEDALGPGLAAALARSAPQLRADSDALDALAAAESWRIQSADPRLAGPGQRGAAAGGDGTGHAGESRPAGRLTAQALARR